MLETLSLFEHESKPFPWDERDVAALERMRAAAGADVLRATSARGEKFLQAAQHVGVVRLRKRTIQILPKIDYSAEGLTAQQTATRNLLHMLAYAEDVPVAEQELAPLLRREADWFEILTWLFAWHLREEWLRGPVRCYQVREDDLPALRGKWRVWDQLRRPERKHIFACSYDEFTADNPLNQVFRYVVERLWRLTNDPENRRLLGELRQWMEEEVPLPPSVTVADAGPHLLTRLNRRYEPLLNLARLFLDQGALQLSAGDFTTFAFVLDMNRLFESFVVRIICRHRRDILPDLANCDLLPQSTGEPLYLAAKDGQRVFRVRPDLACRDEDGYFRSSSTRSTSNWRHRTRLRAFRATTSTRCTRTRRGTTARA